MLEMWSVHDFMDKHWTTLNLKGRFAFGLFAYTASFSRCTQTFAAPTFSGVSAARNGDRVTMSSRFSIRLLVARVHLGPLT